MRCAATSSAERSVCAEPSRLVCGSADVSYKLASQLYCAEPVKYTHHARLLAKEVGPLRERTVHAALPARLQMVAASVVIRNIATAEEIQWPARTRSEPGRMCSRSAVPESRSLSAGQSWRSTLA